MSYVVMEDARVRAAVELLEHRGDVGTLLRILEVRKDATLAEDRAYQRTFTGYYRMGRKKDSFYQAYYSMLKTAASDEFSPSIRNLLLELFEQTGEKHLSFSSKLCATLDDNAVIFDKNVATYFRVPHGDLGRSNWLDKALDRYEKVRNGINAFVNQPTWPSIRDQFNESFREATNLPDIRVADLIIWADGATR